MSPHLDGVVPKDQQNRCSLRRRALVVPYRQPPEPPEGRAIPKRTGSTGWNGSKEPVRPIQDPVVRSPSSAVVVAAEEHDKSTPSPTHFRHCGGIVLTACTCRRARAPNRLPSCTRRRDREGRGGRRLSAVQDRRVDVDLRVSWSLALLLGWLLRRPRGWRRAREILAGKVVLRCAGPRKTLPHATAGPNANHEGHGAGQAYGVRGSHNQPAIADAMPVRVFHGR